MSELNINQRASTIFQDNRGAIDWSTAGNAKQFSRRKHVDIRYNFVTSEVGNGSVKLL